MRKGILAIAAAGSVFAMTAAFATGITLTGGDTLKGKTSSNVGVTSSVCHDTFAVSYTLTDNNTITHVIFTDTTVTPTAGCISTATGALTLTGTRLGGVGSLTASATVDVDGVFDFTLATPYALGTLTDTAIVITGA